jgi:single-strand DNA-binding protein
MLNRVILFGNLGRAPEFKKTQEGKDLAILSLATSFSWKGVDGEWNKHVDWHHVIVLNEPTVRWMQDVMRKGDPVYVEGKLMYKESVDKFGQKRAVANVVVGERGGRVRLMRDTKLVSINVNSDPTFEINTQPDEGQPQ